ncbi:MAG: hypothetical protein L3J45_00955 [Flavobacteriaceae bacterium]|nr:hypothetical protein [Flavobacteriaceae bacterium]
MLQLNKDDEVVVFRSAQIGDFLVVLPFINYLLNTICIPENKIHFVIVNKTKFNPLKFVFNKDSFLVNNSKVLNPNNILKDVLRLRDYFNKKSFTKIIYLSFANESFLSKVKKLIAIKSICGFNKKVYGILLKNKTNYVKSQYLSYFEKLGLYNYNSYLNFGIDKLIQLDTLEVKSIKSIKIDSNKKNIALYINSKLKMKVWDRKEYFKVIDYLYKNYEVNIFLIGGKEDFDYNEKFINDFKFEDIMNLAGNLTIRESFYFFEKIDLLISNDGAPIHMAAYSNCAILGIYTYKEEVGSWEPFKSKRFITVRKDVSCKHCFLEKCDNVICLKALTFFNIKHYINQLLMSKECRNSVIVY